MTSNISRKLSKEEFEAAVKLTYDYFDKNKNGQLNKLEISNIIGAIQNKLDFQLTENLLDFIFTKIDTDKDGGVSLKELHSILSEKYFK